MITKKYYQEFANVIRDMNHIPDQYRKEFAFAVINFFSKDNSKFDTGRFIVACGLNKQAATEK